MDTCKYIVVDTHEGGQAAFLFPPFVNHRKFALTITHDLTRVVSAGFVSLSAAGPVAYGDSESLKLKSRGIDDTHLIRRLLPE